MSVNHFQAVVNPSRVRQQHLRRNITLHQLSSTLYIYPDNGKMKGSSSYTLRHMELQNPRQQAHSDTRISTQKRRESEQNNSKHLLTHQSKIHHHRHLLQVRNYSGEANRLAHAARWLQNEIKARATDTQPNTFSTCLSHVSRKALEKLFAFPECSQEMGPS